MLGKNGLILWRVYMSNVSLEHGQLSNLRDRGLLKEEEIAYKAGDLLIAENPITGEKRVLGQTVAILTESTKRVLKG